MDRSDIGKALPHLPIYSQTHEVPNLPLYSSNRPLSDIRELTEPSLIESPSRKPIRCPRRSFDSSSITRKARKDHPTIHPIPPIPPRQKDDYPLVNQSPSRSPSRHVGLHTRAPSIPPRSASRPEPWINRSFDGTNAARSSSRTHFYTVPNEGQSSSPVKHVVERLGHLNSKQAHRLPSKTILKIDEAAYQLLDNPTYKHPRVTIEIQVSAPLFVGGSSVEGKIHIVIDEAERTRHRKSLTISVVSVDLLGVEELSTNRRSIFLALGNELIDASHPPPYDMIDSLQPVSSSEPSWVLVPSSTSLPFLISLPLHVGPPPFHSRYARIRYVIVATMQIKDAGKEWVVRRSQDTAVLSVHDPEKALMSLPSPLTASDKCLTSRGSNTEYIRATAGLHRQTWVSGTSIFVDVHISNNSRKPVKRMELQLQRDILCYEHTPAATLEMSASQARLYDRNERSILSRKIIKPGLHGWNGVPPQSADLRTCELELPRNEASVECNKFFEVRYYLNVVVGTSHSRLISIQLPVHLIHMNSLDVPTNSVAQIAAAIERRAQRTRSQTAESPRSARKSSKLSQGRAFAAPRMHSLERIREHEQNLEEIGRILEASPRRASFQSDRVPGPSFEFKTPPSNRKGRVILGDDADELRRRLRHVRSAASQGTVNSALAGRAASRTSQARPVSALTMRAAAAADGQQDDDRGPARLSAPLNLMARLEARRSLEFLKPRWPSERWKQLPAAWWDGRRSDRGQA